MRRSVQYYRSILSPLIRVRKWILATGSLADSLDWIELLRDLGGEAPYVLAESLGAGQYPSNESAQWSVLCSSASDIMSLFRNYEAWLKELPREIVNNIDRYDPDRTALILATSLYALDRIAGREVFALRRQEWLALEDKVRIDSLWDAAGVRRASSRIIPVDSEQLWGVSQELDWGLGTVWAGDAREGFNAGASYLRWVCTREDALTATRFFRAHCDRVRVMPFLEGRPCSIHGIVFPQSVIAFRPAELVVFRVPAENRLVYAGNSTFWDPPREDREYMRALAIRVGQYLQKEVAYLGAFNIDGVLTSSGFLPTEMNTRYGVALDTIAKSIPGLPLALLEMAVRRGEPLPYNPQDLESLVVKAADANRNGAGWGLTKTRWERVEEHALARKNDQFRFAEWGEVPDVWIILGPSQVGGMIHIKLNPRRIPIGQSVAPLITQAFAFADAKFGTSFGPLVPALDIR